LNDQRKLEFWERVFSPKAVAVFGAHPTKLLTFANMYLLANKTAGYEGKIYPIGIRGGETLGEKIYKSLSEVSDQIDFACVAVPAAHVLEVLEDCLRHKVPAAQILTAGFGEAGTEEGARLEAEIVAIAAKGLRIIGPNCFGIHDPKCGLTIMPGGAFSRQPGTVAFISQSGGQAVDMGYSSIGLGFGWRRMVSIGNACDVDVTELIYLFAIDPECKIIAGYIEGVGDGRKFFDALKAASLKKPVILWKVGLTESGSKAVNSHTGSMGGTEAIWTSALKQAGAVMVASQEELLDTIAAFHHIGEWTGSGISGVGGGGAMSAAIADSAERAGFALPEFAQSTRDAVKPLLAPVGTSADNPIDGGNPMLTPDVLGQLMEHAAKDESIDAVVLMQYVHHITFLSRMSLRAPDMPLDKIAWHEPLADECKRVRDAAGVPVIQVLPPVSTEVEKLEVEEILRKWRAASHDRGIPTFPNLDRAMKAISHLNNYWKWRKGVN